MSDALKEFKELGHMASYHFADDTGSEWKYGYKLKDEALRLFDENVNLQPEMREIAKGFLWSLSQWRPEHD